MIKAEVQWLQRNDLLVTGLDYDARYAAERGYAGDVTSFRWSLNHLDVTRAIVQNLSYHTTSALIMVLLPFIAFRFYYQNFLTIISY